MRRHLRRTIRGADPLVRAGPPGPAYPQRNQLHSVASPIPGASRAPFTPNCTLAKLPNCTFPMSARTRYTHPVTRERHAIIQDFTGGNHPHRPSPRSAPTSRQYRDQRLLPRSAERVRTASRPRLPPHHRAAGGVRREPALPGRRGVEPLARSTRRGHSDFGFDELQHFRRHVTRLPPGARTPRQPPPPHAAVPTWLAHPPLTLCVIAVQRRSRSLPIKPATTLLLPMFRACPAHHHLHQSCLSNSANRRLISTSSLRISGTCAMLASCSRCCFSGRAGVPQTVCPLRTIFDGSTPPPEPSTARVSIRALSPIPTCPPITA